jgi:hypothetical protein
MANSVAQDEADGRVDVELMNSSYIILSNSQAHAVRFAYS